MSEFDLRNNYLVSGGYLYDSSTLDLHLYRLLSIFGASHFIVSNLKDEDIDNSINIFKVFRDIEYRQISYHLVSIAVICRNALDNSDYNSDYNVGVLYTNKKSTPLTFREACNKIIHTLDINYDLENALNIYEGYLLPKLYLYGEYNNKEWKVELDVIMFCKSAWEIL